MILWGMYLYCCLYWDVMLFLVGNVLGIWYNMGIICVIKLLYKNIDICYYI